MNVFDNKPALHCFGQLTKRRCHAIRKDVLLEPRIPNVSANVVTYSMQKAYPFRTQRIVYDIHKSLVILTANVFKHTDGYDSIKFAIYVSEVLKPDVHGQPLTPFLSE